MGADEWRPACGNGNPQACAAGRRKHVTVDGAWTVIRGDLTPGGDAGTCGQPVRGPFAGITVRVPEDPQNHDQHERDGEHRQGEQRPREHAAFDEQEHDHGEDQREHAHHRAGTDHEMAFLVGQAFQQMRVPAQPYARLGRFKPFHTSMTLRRLSAFSSSRSYEPSFQYRTIPFLLRDCFSLEGLVSRRFSQARRVEHVRPHGSGDGKDHAWMLVSDTPDAIALRQTWDLVEFVLAQIRMRRFSRECSHHPAGR